MTRRLLETATTVRHRPRFEGSNIMTWVGFKHVMYLLEEAVLEHFRQSGHPPTELFEGYGLCFNVVTANARILHALHYDDMVETEVTPRIKPGETELAFKVQHFVDRDDKRLKACVADVRVVLKRDASLGFAPSSRAHPLLGDYVVDELKRRPELRREPLPAKPEVPGPNGTPIPACFATAARPLVRKSRIPYYYCHGNDHLQMSGYLRYLEAAQDLFLEERGMSIAHYLAAKRWIPVVSTARVEFLDEAKMEETFYLVYTPQELIKDVLHTSSMDCYVQREERLHHVATGLLTMGYAVIDDRHNWSLVPFDEDALARFGGGQ